MAAQDQIPGIEGAGYAAGSGAFISNPIIPTVAAFRASGAPSVAAAVLPVLPAPPVAAPLATLPSRISALRDRAAAGLQQLLGIAPTPTPTPAPQTTAQLEQGLNALEARSSPNLYQLRVAAAAQPAAGPVFQQPATTPPPRY